MSLGAPWVPIWSIPCRYEGDNGRSRTVKEMKEKGQYPFIDGIAVSGIYRSQRGTSSKESTPKLQRGGERSRAYLSNLILKES